MDNHINNIQLQFSCLENWNDMTQTNGGRHCDKCQKKVYDFTDSRADEFRKILTENNFNVCGRFSKEQMAPAATHLPLWKKWVSAAMVLIGFNFFGTKASAQTPGKKSGDHKSSHKASTPALSAQQDVATVGVFIEMMPLFPGGDEKFQAYVSKKINYDHIDSAGKVIVSFDVERDGTLTNIKALSGPSERTNAEVVRIIGQSPKWSPGSSAGKLKKSTYTLPIIVSKP
jgi:hypothetical protein